MSLKVIKLCSAWWSISWYRLSRHISDNLLQPFVKLDTRLELHLINQQNTASICFSFSGHLQTEPLQDVMLNAWGEWSALHTTTESAIWWQWILHRAKVFIAITTDDGPYTQTLLDGFLWPADAVSFAIWLLQFFNLIVIQELCEIFAQIDFSLPWLLQLQKHKQHPENKVKN